MKYTIDNHKHSYANPKDYPVCRFCGLLRSTIEHRNFIDKSAKVDKSMAKQYKAMAEMHVPKHLDDKITETAEKIVIDYANFSGRESANRAEFRERIIKHLQDLVQPPKEELI